MIAPVDASRLFNVGIMWVRSTVRTVEMVRRVENRSFGGWEQGIFNEEVHVVRSEK